MPVTNQEISLRIQEKFEFYLLSLTFVILGLSIQTAKFGDSLLSDSFELLGWTSFLISCLAGLSRMEWLPQMYKLAHEKYQRIKYYDEAKLRKLQGETFVLDEENKKQPIDVFINGVNEGVQGLESKLEELNDKNILKYRVHKFAFALGLFCLLISRGYKPLSDIIDWII